MQFDTSLSLDLVLAILAILAAVWRLEGKFDKQLSALRNELKADRVELRNEFKADRAELRKELKADYVELRNELKADNAELRKEIKSDYAELRIDLRRVEGKVDDSNQRLARLEGIILAREDMVDTVVGTSQ